MKCCDTCKHFLYNGNKSELTGKPIGICDGPAPPWALHMIRIAGEEITRVQSDSGDDCVVYESDTVRTPSTQ